MNSVRIDLRMRDEKEFDGRDASSNIDTARDVYW
jgi:hypothetical protein